MGKEATAGGYEENRREIMGLEKLRTRPDLVDQIDWEMTPEEAVRLYLEWGNNWASGNYVIRSRHDVTHYLVVYTWEDPPVIYLIRRNCEEARELARIEMPGWLSRRFLEEMGFNKGIYPVRGEVRQWLEGQLQRR